MKESILKLLHTVVALLYGLYMAVALVIFSFTGKIVTSSELLIFIVGVYILLSYEIKYNKNK